MNKTVKLVSFLLVFLVIIGNFYFTALADDENMDATGAKGFVESSDNSEIENNEDKNINSLEGNSDIDNSLEGNSDIDNSLEGNSDIDSQLEKGNEEIETVRKTHPKFDDVFVDTYYYDAINYMYENRYFVGYGNGKFGPNNNITLVEVLTVLYRIADYRFYTKGDYWYSSVYNEAINQGVIDESDSPNKIVNRYEIAKYIVKIFKIDTSNLDIENAFVDINDSIVNTMYHNGIFIGIDTEDGTVFNTDSPIIRGDLSLVLMRLIEYLNIENCFYIGDVRIMNYPTSEKDFMKVIQALGKTGDFNLIIDYSSNVINPSQFKMIKSNIFTAFEKSFMMHPEYMSFTSNLGVTKIITEGSDKWSITINFKSEFFDDDTLKNMFETFFIESNEINKTLKEKGLISASNTVLQNVKNIFEYVVYSVSYDYEDTGEGYNGYGASHNKSAVCQGYTALFNELCLLNGYNAEGVVGYVKGISDSHMWSKVKIDNEWYYFDTTFADLDINGVYDANYFNMSFDEMIVDRIVYFESSSEG